MSSIINTSRVAIVGLGQLGGSLAMRLNEIGCRSLYAITRREESLRAALELNILEAGSTDPADILPVVDITFICLPLPATIEFVKKNLADFRAGSIVTDIGSVKGAIVSELRPILLEKGVYFIGGHPMAGSEKSGWENSAPDLYKGATVFLTPIHDDEAMAIDLLRDFWVEIGACPIEIDPERHDNAVAYSSHFLHLLSSSICKTVLSRGDTEANEIACAGGFRDTTRIASSSAEMWTEIISYNQDSILKAMDDFQKEIDEVRTNVKEKNWDAIHDYFSKAKNLRDQWCVNYENRG